MIVCRTEDRVGQETCLNNAKGNESTTNDAGSERWALKQDSDPQEAITKEDKKVSGRMEGKGQFARRSWKNILRWGMKELNGASEKPNFRTPGTGEMITLIEQS